MEEENNNSSRSNLKRPFHEDEMDDSNKPPAQKRVRFPKGKKVKPGEEAIVEPVRDKEDDIVVAKARSVAKERAKSRSKITTELFNEQSTEVLHDISAAEVNYEETGNLDDNGIQLEPFNLDKEREEGYFDADGNFVEYISTNEVKDAWLDSVEVNQRFAGKYSAVTKDAEETPDLTTIDIGKIKRYIADLLQPNETVLQALRRMKGKSNNRKEKMSENTKLVFDQLTEYAMKLLENGDYNVYHEKQEVFEREAEGYERLSWAKGEGTSSSVLPGISVSSSVAEMTSGSAAETFDMFGEDDDTTTISLSSDGSNLLAGSGSKTISQPSEVLTADFTNQAVDNDYAYDESSGYYYSSSLGYYYDSSSGLYCSAASGQWYSYNVETCTYDEFQEAVNNVS